jgi:hypothetical protein
MKHMKLHEKRGHLGGFRKRSTFNAQVSVQNLETRAALCAGRGTAFARRFATTLVL